MNQIMGPEHPQWDDFIKLLAGPEGCNYHQKKGKDPQWTCGGDDKPMARAILEKYFPDVDIEETMKFFEERGGYCDCEIIFNVTQCTS